MKTTQGFVPLACFSFSATCSFSCKSTHVSHQPYLRFRGGVGANGQAAPPRTPTATAPTRAKAKSRTRTDKTDAAGTEAKTEVKRIRIRKPDLRRGRQRNRASGSRPRKPPPPVVVEQEESEEESEEGSDEESEQESEEEEEVERPAKGAKTKCVSAAEVEVAGGEAAIGRRLRIFWREERKWFKGTVRLALPLSWVGVLVQGAIVLGVWEWEKTHA